MASRRSGGKRMRLDDDDNQDEVSICEEKFRNKTVFLLNLMTEISDAPFVRDA